MFTLFLKNTLFLKKKKKKKLHTTTFKIAANIEYMEIRNYPLLPGKNANIYLRYFDDALFW